MKRSEILKYFDYQWDSGDYDSKDEKYTITHIGHKWCLLGVIDKEDHNEYTDSGEYSTLSDAVYFYINSVFPNKVVAL
jgi:hypothetical protein